MTNRFNPRQKIYKRKFTAFNNVTKEKRSIRHIQYDKWEDKTCADPEFLARLVELVDAVKEPDSPILVHCAAGIGRSGSFVLAHSLRCQLLQNMQTTDNPKINPIMLSIYLRMQRSKLGTSSNQYKTAISSLLYMPEFAHINQD